MTKTLRFTRMDLLNAISYMNGLLQNMEIKKTRDFSYFLNRNTKMLRTHWDLAAGIYDGTRSPEYEDYRRGVDNIILKHATRRDNGEPVKTPSGLILSSNPKARDDEITAWTDKHKETLAKHEAQMNEALELLHVSEDFEVFPIELAKVPEEIDITPMAMFIVENEDLYLPPVAEIKEVVKEESAETGKQDGQ